MKIEFTLKESIYDCNLQITDMQGTRYFHIPAVAENELTEQSMTIDIFSDEFDLILIPELPNYQQMLNELDGNGWKDKLIKKAGKMLFSSIEDMLLRVGCNYHLQGLQDGDRLDLTLQIYAYGTFDRFDLLGLIPMAYMFFEASCLDCRFKLSDAFETNRKAVIKATKKLALADILGNGIFIIFTYPIQMGRVKRLSKNKKIFKTLTKFHNMSDEERRKFKERMDKL